MMNDVMNMNNDNWPIVDLHCHMMPGIDDGSTDLDMTREMLRMSYDQGVRGLFLTSHSYGMDGRVTRYLKNFEILEKLCAEEFPELSLYPGTEVECDLSSMEDVLLSLSEGTYLTLNHGKCVLAEFYDSTMGFSGMKKCLQMLIDSGYTPVVAHAERYGKFYEDAVENIRELKSMGCLVQINFYSVEEEHYDRTKRIANDLLREKLVDFVGTDAHRIGHREPRVTRGAKAIRERYGDQYAREICFDNAKRVFGIHGKEMIQLIRKVSV